MADLAGPNADEINGDIAHDAVDIGNPVKIGGIASDAGQTAVAVNDRVNAWFTRLGQLQVAVDYAGDSGSDARTLLSFGYRSQTAAGDGTSRPVATGGFAYNGTNWDRVRGDTSGLLVHGPTASDAGIGVAPLTIGGRASTAVPTAVSADGDVVDARFLRNGAQVTHLVDTAGVSISKAIDSVAGGTDPGIPLLAVRDDSLSALTPVDGDYVPLRTTSDGALWTYVTGNVWMQGEIAHDGVDSGNPLKIGGFAKDTAPAAVSADGDRVNAWFLRNGIQNVRLVDSSGVALPGGTQYVEDTAFGGNGTGTLMMGRRDDALSTLTPVADDAVGLRVGDKGALWVQISDGSGNQITSFGGGTQYVGDAAATATPTGTIAMGLASAAAPTDVSANNDAVAAWHLRNGAAATVITAAGALIGGDAANGLDVDVTRLPALVAGSANIGDVDVLTVPADPFGANADAASATGSISAKLRLLAATALVGDAAATATPTGLMSLALAKAAAPTDVSADNDAVALWALRNGSLVVNLAAGGTLLTNMGQAAASGQFVRLTDGTLTVGVTDETGASAVDSLAVGGGTPHDSVDSGNPQKIGGKAVSAVPSFVASNDRVNAWFGVAGQQMVSDIAKVDTTGADAQNLGLSLTADGSFSNTPRPTAMYGFNGTGFDRLKTSAGVTVAGTPNTDLGILATGVGPGWDRKRDPAGVAATSTANAVTITVDGADAIVLHVTAIGTTPGSMIIEQTADDGAWVTAGAVLKLGALDTWVEGSFVPAVNDVYMVRCNGVRQVRYRVNAVYASGTATVKWTGVNGTPIIKSIEMPGAPHKIGYALASKTAQYTSAQTSTTIGPTVASTQRLVVTYLQIQAGGTVAATQCSVYFGTGAYSRGTNSAIFDGEFAPSATLKPGFVSSPPIPWMGAADEELKITTVGAANPLTVTIWYYLITA